jgi:metallophosphoesterase (TIGR00282 family)
MSLKVLFIGDIVGQPGQDYVREMLPTIIDQRGPDLIIANAENATNGRGLNQATAERLYDAGVEIITMGNHTWDQKELLNFIDQDERIVRPGNYPDGTPGRGYTLCQVNHQDVLIINVMGRTFLSLLDCPFRTIEQILILYPHVKHVFIDVHAETTSEKLSLGWHFDGKVSAVLGTHTHVQTSDERILPNGTGYMTDVGMVGPRDGILGMERSGVIHRMRTHMPTRFHVAVGARQFSAVFLEVDDRTGQTQSIERIYLHE